MRFGYAAKGFVYAIVGILAAQAAIGGGGGGKTTNTKGALKTIVTQPFGKVLLALVAIGLVGYVLWRFVQAIQDPENKGTDAKGLVTRLGYGFSGIAYAGLALIFGAGGGSSGGSSTQTWTARLLAQPFGQWLVGTIGAIVIAIAGYQFYRAYSAKFRKKLKTHQMSRTEQTWATRVGRFGLATRGITFLIIGWFLIQAPLQAQAQEARGLGGALETLAQQPYGPWLLGIVALGLIAYGIHMGVQARYRRMQTS